MILVEFQEVESNYSGRLSYVSSQLAMIPSSRSMLSRDKRLPLDTWNSSGLHENFLVINFSTFGSPRNPSQGFSMVSHIKHEERQNQFHEQEEQGPLSQEMTSKIKDTIPMPTFARRPSTMSSLLLVDIPQNSMVGQQRQQISELQFDKFRTPLFYVGR